MIHDKFIEILKQLLIEQNLTQKELSERTGIPASTIACWFGKQHSLPSLESAYLLSEALDCSIDYLVGKEVDF